MRTILRSIKVTTIHKFWVARYLIPFALRLIWRAIIHDASKYSKGEIGAFGRLSQTANVAYGSQEYKDRIAREKPAVELHQSRNSHHPEYWYDGFIDMDALSRIEMVADWIAASRRYAQRGNFYESIEISQKRYNLTDDDTAFLARIAQEMLRGKEKA